MPERHDYDALFHPRELLRLMSEGYTDTEIMAEWGISYKKFHKWIADNEDFKEAFEAGYPKWEAAWLKKGKEYMDAGKDKAYRYWDRVLTVKGNNEWKKLLKQEGNVTNINVNNMNLLQNKSEQELIDILTSKMSKLSLLTGQETKVIEITPEIIEEKKNDTE